MRHLGSFKVVRVEYEDTDQQRRINGTFHQRTQHRCEREATAVNHQQLLSRLLALIHADAAYEAQHGTENAVNYAIVMVGELRQLSLRIRQLVDDYEHTRIR